VCLAWPLLALAIALQLPVGAAVAAESDKANYQTIKIEDRRAKFNYQMFCQGCHVADGSGHKSVPELKGFIHKFMASQAGREYLIRVPGAANSALIDEELAELMNWMLREFGDSKDVQWRPFDAQEVNKYRQAPLNETVKYREKLITSLKLESEL